MTPSQAKAKVDVEVHFELKAKALFAQKVAARLRVLRLCGIGPKALMRRELTGDCDWGMYNRRTPPQVPGRTPISHL